MDTRITVPDVVYHGTTFRFDRFQSSPSGIHFGNLAQAAHRLSWELAKMEPTRFAELPVMEKGMKGYILQCRLRIERLKRVRDQRTAVAWQKSIEQAKAEGFDGMYYQNRYEMPHSPALSWVVFDPHQIEIIGYER